MSTMTLFQMNAEINSLTCGGCFVLTTKLDSSDITRWQSGVVGGTGLVRTAALPRNWNFFADKFDRYRIMRVRHYVKLSRAPSSTGRDSIIAVVQTSIGHRDQPFLHPPPISTPGVAAPFDTLNLWSQKLENYRHTRKFRLTHNNSTKTDVNFMAQPYIFKDNTGQKIIGGKQKDDAGGPGVAISNLTTTTNVDVGLCGEIYVYIFPLDHQRVGSHVDIDVRVRTVFDIEFYDRKLNAQIQTGGFF